MLADFDNDNRATVVYTTTKEPIMPVRLYYKIYNEDLLIKSLKKLKCIGFESKKSFILAYYKEAKNLDLEVYYQDVPEGLYPVSLAYGSIKQNSILHLDLRSLQRAVCIIDFLGKHIPPTIMEITSFANSNKLTVTHNKQELEELLNLDFDQIFIESRIQDIAQVIKLDDKKEEKALTGSANPESLDETLEMLMPYIGEENLVTYPDVERISINYNRKRHDSLIAWLSMRALIKEEVAIAHYKGNSSYSSMDVIQELFLAFNNDLESNNDQG